MHFFVFFLCFFSPLFAHTTEFFTRTEVVFETSENRHCYSRSSPLEFSRILLQSKILAEGVNAKAFPPDAGLEWLQTQENLSIFTLKNGFSWENFQFPHSFEIEYQTLENGEILAKALSHKVPWGHYPFSVLLELRHGDERKILHHGALETPLCFVEYLAGGLRVADFYSTDRNPENQLSFIRAGVALEGIKLSDLALGKYELVAEFRGIQDVLFAQGKYHFEIVPEDWVPPEKNLFLEVEVPQIMDKQGI
jgi:hypothetical protein